MNNFTFEFNGINSKEFGLYATSMDIYSANKRQARKEIPRRHGTYNYRTGTYNDRILELRCFWIKPKTRHDIREIALWLSQDEGRIVLDIEPDKHYAGTIYEPQNIAARFNRAFEDNHSQNGNIDLIFSCRPFAYGAQVVQSIRTGHNPIDYNGTADTPTLIVLRNPHSVPIRGITLTAISHF